MIRLILCLSILLSLSAPTLAGREDFVSGTAVPDYGVYAPVPGVELLAGTQMKIAFDVSAAGPDDAVNRKFEMVARSVNLHTAKGVSAENKSNHGGFLWLINTLVNEVPECKPDRYGDFCGSVTLILTRHAEPDAASIIHRLQ